MRDPATCFGAHCLWRASWVLDESRVPAVSWTKHLLPVWSYEGGQDAHPLFGFRKAGKMPAPLRRQKIKNRPEAVVCLPAGQLGWGGKEKRSAATTTQQAQQAQATENAQRSRFGNRSKDQRE
jgi:hypothetical protein